MIFEKALSILQDDFHSLGHAPSQSQIDALEDLLRHFSLMAEGGLKPAYYVSPLDPGIGKTRAVRAFLRAVLELPEANQVGVILAQFRRDEIRQLIVDAQLPSDSFCVLTADKDLNALGKSTPEDAQILFTTQQRVALLTRRQGFRDCQPFFFKGRARKAIIWDESFTFRKPICLRRYDLSSILREVRDGFPDEAKKLDSWLSSFSEAEDGARVLFNTFGVDLEGALSGTKWNLTSDKLEVLFQIVVASNTPLVVRRETLEDEQALVSAATVLPEDLLPIVILDASARVRETYKLWQRNVGNLVFLKSAEKRYQNLTVHWWQKGAGRSTVGEDPELYTEAIAGLVDEILTGSSDAKVVLIHYKPRKGPRETNIASEVRKRLPEAGQRFSDITWGQHTATNEYVDFTHVILLGGLYLRDTEIEAGFLASSDKDGEYEATKEELDQFALGEQLHHLLQAVCRIGVRKADHRKRDYHAYVVASSKHKFGEKFGDLFPGAKVVSWEPPIERLVGNQRRLIDLLDSKLLVPGVRISFKDVMRELDIKSQRLTELRRNENVKAALEKRRIREAVVRSRVTGFIKE